MIQNGSTCGEQGRFSPALVFQVILLTLLLSSPGILGSAEPADSDGTTLASEGKAYEVPPPPLSDDYFPCSMCHEDMEVNRERRELTEEHLEIVLKHDEEHRWCLDCHDADNRDVLRLASGTPVEFTESYVLCGPGFTASGRVTGGVTNSTCSVSTATTRTRRASSPSNRCRRRCGRRIFVEREIDTETGTECQAQHLTARLSAHRRPGFGGPGPGLL